MVTHLLWSILISFLKANWLTALIILFAAFVVLTIKAGLGRWGPLGSLLYNVLYFGVLFVIGLIWGPEIFLDDFFKVVCVVILYPICFRLVGYMLDKMGVRK